MKCFTYVLGMAFAILPTAVLRAQQTAPPQPVQVMIVGGFHMSNPGHDIHNVVVDDVLQPKPQSEIKAAVDTLTTFRPTKVMAEWPQDIADERFTKYIAGTLPPSHNEVVQLGFRLAKQAGLPKIYGIDVDGDFPYEAVQTFAQAHGKTALLERENGDMDNLTQTLSSLLKTKGIVATLRYLNDPTRLRNDNSFYREMLFIGAGTQQPGADLLSAWYKRNFLICANILQNSVPGDHIVVFYGSGHAFLLRQCVMETPGFTLVEPNDYLPK
ncbi:MAG: DUF5694 domain-containing protein [Janthinobacterium lividum]